MSLLRIYGTLREQPQHCRWAFAGSGAEATAGKGPFSQLPQRAKKVHLVLPASDVLLVRARLPQGARRREGALLEYAVEEMTVGESGAIEVFWLGQRGGFDVLAVLDRPGLRRWLDALQAAGIQSCEVHCEALMLPLVPGEWSLAWNGSEGFVRTGDCEGAATDSGDRATPPLSLRLMLEEARARGEEPSSIALYAAGPEAAAQGGTNAAPDAVAWQRSLGIAIRFAGTWDWPTASTETGFCIMQERRRWRPSPGTLARLRPAAWVVGIALSLHAVALAADWALLASEQKALRAQMGARFRSAFPEAVAVTDPALQMRRKLAEARHSAGLADDGDFLPMIEKLAAASKDLPAGTLRVASYESARLTVELVNVEEAVARGLVARLLQAGLRAEPAFAAARAGRANVTITVRAS